MYVTLPLSLPPRTLENLLTRVLRAIKKKNPTNNLVERKRTKGEIVINSFFFLSSRITVVTPANKHSYTASHDVEPGSLFLNQAGTFSCESTSLIGRWVLDERSGGTAAS